MEFICVPVQGTPNLTSFVNKLKRLTDKRDKRGKRHELAFVLGGVVLAIMSGRSYASSIQRFIQNRLKWLRQVLGYWGAKAVSRAQLPRILDGVDWSDLNELGEDQFGMRIEVRGKEWHAVDGKTLRRVAGQRERGLLAVSHSGRQTVAQRPLHGPKKSEITAVRELLAQTGLEKGKNTLDALHFNPTTTRQINRAGGQFIIQLKANQPHLLAQLSQEAAEARPVGCLKTVDKGHGRLEIRQAAFFKINHLQLDPRWAESGLTTLIVLARRTTDLTPQKRSAEVSFYCANVALDPADEATQQELFQAIRGYWGVEADNYIRDVSFQEDKVRTKHGNQAQVLASLRTVAIQLLREAGFVNFKAALETFADCPDQFEAVLIQYGFL
ncbi:MAG: ISAs1 family transposase [Chloroflexota bacterium]